MSVVELSAVRPTRIDRRRPADVRAAFSAAIGPAHVSAADPDLDAAATATYATSERPHLVVRPAGHEEVQACLSIARAANLTVHPVSSGVNWGFGSRVPRADGSVLLELKRMKKLELSESTRRVTLGPGVTQQELFETVKRQQANLMVPLSGSLPQSSIAGNAAAGGTTTGVNVIRWDHVLSLQGILHSGEVIRTGLTRLSESSRVRGTRYGTGPDLLGLFRDSDLGVITEMTIELPPIPRILQVYFFSITDDGKLPPLVDALTCLKDEGLIVGDWFMLHGWRILAESLGRYPWRQMDGRTPMRREKMMELLAGADIPVWNGLFNGAFATYLPSARMGAAVREEIEEKLKPFVSGFRCIELDRDTLLGLREDPDLPIAGAEHNVLKSRIRTFAGIPKQGFVTIGYWRKPKATVAALGLDRDRCGFLWLNCSAPASGSDVLYFIRTVERIFGEFDFEPMVVVDAVRGRELYLQVALTFDRDRPGEDERALACFEAAVKALGERDLYPFRVPIGLRHLLPASLDDSEGLIRRIKEPVS
jgi:4-cresol dehydrogenase (hydroxylating)